MTLIENPECEVVHRRSGGWLAYSSRNQRLRIGVTGRTQDEVVERYRETVAQWRYNIASDPNRGSRG